MWKEGNRHTFQGKACCPADLVHQIVHEASDWAMAGNKCIVVFLSNAISYECVLCYHACHKS
jgi:hypothetical protein